MIIKLYAVDQTTGEESFQTDCYLRDCFDLEDADQLHDYEHCEEQLREHGRVWIGGGAAALFLAVPA